MFTKQQCKKLIKLYPFLLPRNVWTDKPVDKYDYSYLLGEYEIPKGWFILFLMYCKKLRQLLVENNYLYEFRFSQLKEKYGHLCLYDFGKPESAQYLTSMFEGFSSNICEYCGKLSEWQVSGCIMYLCSDCIKRFTRGAKRIKYSKELNITEYSKNERARICISYKNLNKEYAHVSKLSVDDLFDYMMNC